MSKSDPTSYNRPDAEFLSDAQIDNVGRALLTLTREVCVLSDRMLVMEAILEDSGITDLHERIERFQPDEALQQRSGDAMGKIVASVMASLQGAERELA